MNWQKIKSHKMIIIQTVLLNRSRFTAFALGIAGLFVTLWLAPAGAAVVNQSLCVRPLTKTMKDGMSVNFWGFTDNCMGMMTVGKLPAPTIELGVGDTLNLTLSVMMAPQETNDTRSPYFGHTIHLHGADVPTSQDGVPETGASTQGAKYVWSPTAEMAGSYMYHCHVHTVKHLEMGMYGALVVRPKDTAGNYLNQLTPDPKTAYDVAENLVFSTVDPDYHAAVGDSVVFSDYNPRYFLINGSEGASPNDPAVTVAAKMNAKVALRLVGIHSVSGTFSLRDSAGNAQPFTVFVQDGRQWPVPETMTQLAIGSGQRFDIVFSTPAISGAWYPQMSYNTLRDGKTYAITYAKVSF